MSDGRRILMTREATPAGSVIYIEEFDQLGRIIKRDVEHVIEVSLSAKAGTDLGA